jgi:hypothetical protein
MSSDAKEQLTKVVSNIVDGPFFCACANKVGIAGSSRTVYCLMLDVAVLLGLELAPGPDYRVAIYSAKESLQPVFLCWLDDYVGDKDELLHNDES